MDTGELIGAEALARWQHPTRGLIAPAGFIPLLEGTSLIHRFTAHVLDLALAQARTLAATPATAYPWRSTCPPAACSTPTFPDTVAHALLRAGVPGNLLCIEITENTVMADPARAIDVLRRIRALGVKTAIDDFGTGYSSMAYLEDPPHRRDQGGPVLRPGHGHRPQQLRPRRIRRRTWATTSGLPSSPRASRTTHRDCAARDWAATSLRATTSPDRWRLKTSPVPDATHGPPVLMGPRTDIARDPCPRPRVETRA